MSEPDDRTWFEKLDGDDQVFCVVMLALVGFMAFVVFLAALS